MPFLCFSCQKELPIIDKVGFREECYSCRADVHCCKNCDFYDPKSYNECRETSADVVREKDRANYCDFFKPNMAGKEKSSQADAMKAAAEALFKKN